MSLRDFFDAVHRFDFSAAEKIAEGFGSVKRDILLSYVDIWRGENRRGLDLANSGKLCPDLPYRQLSYLSKAYHQYFLGQVKGFYEELGRAESYFGILKDHLLGIYFHLKGLMFRLRGDLSGARVYYEKALSVREGCEDHFGEGVTYNNLAFLSLAAGHIKEAVKHIEKSRDCFSLIGNDVMLAFSDANRAIMEYHLGNFDLAESLLRCSLEKYLRLDAPKIYIVDAKKTLAKVLFARGQKSEGVSILTEAIAEYSGEQNSPVYVDLLTELIQMKLRAGMDTEDSLEMLDRIELSDLSSVLKKQSVRVQLLSRGSLIEKVKGLLLAENLLKELPNVEEGFDIRLNFLLTAIETRLEVLGVDYDRKSIATLHKEIDMLYSIGKREGSSRYMVSALIYRALLHLILGETMRADELFKEARSLASSSGNEVLIKQVDEKFSEIHTIPSERLNTKEITSYIKRVNEILNKEFN